MGQPPAAAVLTREHALQALDSLDKSALTSLEDVTDRVRKLSFAGIAIVWRSESTPSPLTISTSFFDVFKPLGRGSLSIINYCSVLVYRSTESQPVRQRLRRAAEEGLGRLLVGFPKAAWFMMLKTG